MILSLLNQGDNTSARLLTTYASLSVLQDYRLLSDWLALEASLLNHRDSVLRPELTSLKTPRVERDADVLKDYKTR
jgi:hypothetical protein